MSDRDEPLEPEDVSSGDRPLSIPPDLPVLPLRDTVLFPNSFMPLAVARESSVRLIDEAIGGGKLIAVFTQREASVEEPTEEDLYRVGTATHIHKMFKLPDGSLRLIVQGLARLQIGKVTATRPYLRADVILAPEETREEDRLEIDALQRNIKSNFQQVVSLSPLLSDDLQTLAGNITDAGRLADFIASSLGTITTATKQEVLETLDVRARMDALNRMLIKELEVLELGSKIQSQVQSEVGRNQREYFLREQLKAIQKELGEGDEQTREVEELRAKIEAAGMPDAVRKEALRELDRLSKMPVAAAEYTVSRTYVDWLVALPWSKRTEEVIDLKRTKQILDADHSDLERAKDRILEYLAVRKLNPDVKGPILCFVGPPGVGKTSLAKSIASSLDRKFVRVSLGGMRDEAEIRGHRRTYIGSMPGRIVQNLNKAGTRNPLFMLDEIDKMSMDFRGDPSSALLEVLDPEQNHSFNDHYLEVDLDLTEVMFVATANSLNIPGPLLDRMEVIRIPGYTEEEKLNIALRYLVPKQLKANGLAATELKITESALRDIVRYFTRESGVRNLEREIAKISRKVVKELALAGPKARKGKVVLVSAKNLDKYLGVRRFDYGRAEAENEIGLVTGLAWTEVGGELLQVESTLVPGKGQLILTGQLGEVMKESASAALSVVRARTESLGIELDFLQKQDVHLHVPEGATPKDGPSAGIAMATALVSTLTKVPVRADVAMTGEITLRGRVLPIGGLKEKLLAALRGGIRTVIIPEENRKDLVDLPKSVSQHMKIVPVRWIDEVLDLALERPLTPAVVVGSLEEVVREADKAPTQPDVKH